MPVLVVFIPRSVQQFAVPLNVGKDTKALRAVAQIVPDLALGRVHAAPARIEREGEGVQVRGDVAGAARVRVVAPGPPDICRTLDHHKVLLAVLLESNSHPKAGEPRPQNGHMDMTGMCFTVGRPTWKSRALVIAGMRLAAARKNLEHDCFLRGCQVVRYVSAVYAICRLRLFRVCMIARLRPVPQPGSGASLEVFKS